MNAVAPKPPIARDYSLHAESPAMTLVGLAEMCASSTFMFAPPGKRWICPSGAKHSLFVNVTRGCADLISSQLRAMRASGRQPFVDLNHTGVLTGNLVDVYWREQSGIMGIVDWIEPAARGIISGEFTNFSPQWVILDGELVGVGLNCGALLSRTVEPAYGKLFCRVGPCTKKKEMNTLAEVFVQKMDRRGCELSASGDEFALNHARDELRLQFPKLYASYALRSSILEEVRHDYALRTR